MCIGRGGDWVFDGVSRVYVCARVAVGVVPLLIPAQLCQAGSPDGDEQLLASFDGIEDTHLSEYGGGGRTRRAKGRESDIGVIVGEGLPALWGDFLPQPSPRSSDTPALERFDEADAGYAILGGERGGGGGGGGGAMDAAAADGRCGSGGMQDVLPPPSPHHVARLPSWAQGSWAARGRSASINLSRAPMIDGASTISRVPSRASSGTVGSRGGREKTKEEKEGGGESVASESGRRNEGREGLAGDGDV